MTGPVHFPFILAMSLALGGCMQRTVTQTQSRIKFSEAWTGDADKIREKYASGFEIRDGVAVATNGKKDLEPEALPVKEIEKKACAVGASEVDAGSKEKKFGGAASIFERLPEFKTASAQSGQKEFATRSADGIDPGQELAVKDTAVGGREFAAASKTAREGVREFFGGKRTARENAARTTQARPDFARDEATGRLTPLPSSLSEEQVRDILHPRG